MITFEATQCTLCATLIASLMRAVPIGYPFSSKIGQDLRNFKSSYPDFHLHLINQLESVYPPTCPAVEQVAWQILGQLIVNRGMRANYNENLRVVGGGKMIVRDRGPTQAPQGPHHHVLAGGPNWQLRSPRANT